MVTRTFRYPEPRVRFSRNPGVGSPAPLCSRYGIVDASMKYRLKQPNFLNFKRYLAF